MTRGKRDDPRGTARDEREHLGGGDLAARFALHGHQRSQVGLVVGAGAPAKVSGQRVDVAGGIRCAWHHSPWTMAASLGPAHFFRRSFARLRTWRKVACGMR